MAEIIRETIRSTEGREYGLSVASRLYNVIGIVGCVASVIAAAATRDLSWILAGLLVLFIGASFSLVYGALAEVIRLLKANSGELYSGTISGSEKSEVYICSDCGTSN